MVPGPGDVTDLDERALHAMVEELRAREARLRALFESTSEGLVLLELVYDDRGRAIDAVYLEVNPGAARLIAAANATGQHARELFPVMEPYWMEALDRAARTGAHQRFEGYSALREMWFDAYMTPLDGPGGRRVAVLFHDVTERRRAEESRRAGEARHEFLLRLEDTLRPIDDPEQILYEASRLLGEHLGVNRVGYAESRPDGETAEVTRHYAHDVVGLEGPYRYDDYGPELLRALRAGRTLVRSDTARDPSLTAAERDAHAVLDLGATVNVPLVKADRLLAVLFVHARDARAWTADEVALIEAVAARTWASLERARAERALRESEERYRTLFESIDEGFAVFDLLFDDDGRLVDLQIVEQNPSCARHTGVVAAAGRRLGELVPALDPTWLQVFEEVVRTGIPRRFERTSPAVGRVFDSYAFRVGRPEQPRIALVFSDVTERKRGEAALARASRLKDEFLAILAHELRNPLAPIRTGVAVLRRSREGASAARALDMMERQLGHMVRLIDDLLDVSRIGRGTLELRRERVALGAAADAAIESVRARLDAAGHRLDVELPAAPLWIDGDPTRLAQVIGNLLDNAIAYTPQPGRITLRVAERGGEAAIDVSDTGVGLPADRLPEVFDMFTRVHRPTAGGRAGLGIGLSLVRSLVELHGGRVWAASEGPGRGSTFSVRLPLATSAPDGPPTDAACSPRRAVRALVIDDNADAAEMLATLLELGGHRVEVALGGLEGIARARRFRPEIAFIDIGMPDLDGYEVARTLRADPTIDALLVAVTGWGSRDDQRRALEAGFDHHLTKPVDTRAVEALVATVAARPG